MKESTSLFLLEPVRQTDLLFFNSLLPEHCIPLQVPRAASEVISPSQNKSLTVKLSIDRTHTVYSSICVIIFLLNFDHFCLIL